MPPRKSNVSQTNAPGEDGTPVKEREGINIEVGRYLPLRPYIYFICICRQSLQISPLRNSLHPHFLRFFGLLSSRYIENHG